MFDNAKLAIVDGDRSARISPTLGLTCGVEMIPRVQMMVSMVSTRISVVEYTILRGSLGINARVYVGLSL